MKVLALEPYFGGSHRAFLEGWSSRSRHEWTILSLPARKWKWRMRHGAVAFAEQAVGGEWDLLFCSDMLNLAEFRGLAGKSVRDLPSVVYFHENQLTYPVRQELERDHHYVFTNITTALAADRVWFNSRFHMESFLGGLAPFLRKMPDHQPLDSVERIRAKSEVHPQGFASFPPRGPRKPGPLRILWAHRWEHDKNPEDFFAALEILEGEGVDFRVDVLGEQFRDSPEVFGAARKRFAGRIGRWGFQESDGAYRSALLEADVAVSTAHHEFFGVGIAEAVAAGAFPCVPRRLSYPEILKEGENPDFFYDGSAAGLAAKLGDLASRADVSPGPSARALVAPYFWDNLVPSLDASLDRAG